MISIITDNQNTLTLFEKETNKKITLFQGNNKLDNLSLFPMNGALEKTEDIPGLFQSLLQKYLQKSGAKDLSEAVNQNPQDIILISLLFQECMIRNQQLRILAVGERTGSVLEILSHTIACFSKEHKLYYIGQEKDHHPEYLNGYLYGTFPDLLPVLFDDSFSIIILDGEVLCKGDFIAREILRKIRPGGYLLVHFKDMDVYSGLFSGLLEKAGIFSLGKAIVFSLRVTAKLKDEAFLHSSDAKILERVMEFFTIWNEAAPLLKEVLTGSLLEGEEKQACYKRLIAYVHVMEKNIIALYPCLENLDIKYLTNQLKSLLIDLYIAFESDPSRISVHLEKLSTFLIEYQRELKKEFPSYMPDES